MNTVFATFAKEFDAIEVLAITDYTPVEIRFNRSSEHSASPRERVLLVLNAFLFQVDALSIEVLALDH